MAMIDRISVTASAAGNASQIPVMPKIADRIKAKMRMATRPLERDVTKDQVAASVAPRYPQATILTDAKI